MKNPEHQNKQIDYILVDPESKETYTLASDENETIEFTPFTQNNNKGYSNVPEWEFNFDYYIYNYLEEGKQIAYMTDNVHYNIWNSINELYPTDIDYKDGVQNYLQYCAENGITKEYLDNKTGFDTPNIMKYFEGLAKNEKIEYRGYIIEVEDLNNDKPQENLVYIYDNEEDYRNKEERETVSLKTIGLKQNIKNYIDEVYFKEQFLEREKAYFTFVLGYDLLNNMLSKSATPENDISYDFCDMIAGEFLKSEEYKNEKHSDFEMLEQWFDKNKIEIKKKYKEFVEVKRSKKTRELNNAIVLDVGYRKKEPIALVERKRKSQIFAKEYVIAFSYKITNNEISWGYGHYYYNNFEKAKQDFDKVINGGNLAHTFDKDSDKSDKEI